MDIAMFSFMRSSMIRNAVKLGIADALRAGPLDAAKLATAVGAAKVSFLERIMRLLIRMGMIKFRIASPHNVSLGVFQQLPDGRYAHTRLSAVLCTTHPSSVVPAIRYLELRLQEEWGGLDQVIKTGEVQPLEEYWAKLNADDELRSTC